MEAILHQSSHRRRLLKAGVASWVLAWTGLAALGAVGLVRSGTPSPALPESQEPTETSVIAPGVTARVGTVEFRARETLVSIHIDGRADLGPAVEPAGLARIRDATGAEFTELGGSISGRMLTLRFPGAVSLQPGAAKLTVPGIALASEPIAGSATVVLGNAFLAVQLATPPDMVRSQIDVSSPLGPGSVYVESVTQQGTDFVVRGMLEFSSQSIQSLSLRTSSLQLVDGTRVTVSGGRHGFGIDSRSFELWFEIPSG
jgi:hypothetical protein